MTVAFIARGFLKFEEKYDRWKDKFWFLLLRTKRQRFQLIKLSHTTVNPLFAKIFFYYFLSWNNATLLNTEKRQIQNIF
jgi:hypothetical protein